MYIHYCILYFCRISIDTVVTWNVCWFTQGYMATWLEDEEFSPQYPSSANTVLCIIQFGLHRWSLVAIYLPNYQ